MSLNNKMEISRKIISEAEVGQGKLSKECGREKYFKNIKETLCSQNNIISSDV